MLRCIAIDDEPLALALLADNIGKVPYLQLVATCGDAFEAVKAMQEHTVDLVFADIQMPGLTGLQFIDSLPVKPLVILITAYQEYALEGYSLSVVDYLLKPVDLLRFMTACNKALELFQLRNAATRQQPGYAAPAPDYFFLNVDYSLLKILFSDIIWIEGLRDYVKIYLKSAPNKPVVARSSIKAMEEQLPGARFIRIHKSYIVSIDSITAIRKNSVFIKEYELTIGETYRTVIRNLTGM
ncbi:LytR/AlgR family response regulator transcription factor [Taibaiella chishuiensis]|uniref:LytTR family two component transcriptional regulator n=1 Tax=Taibaiella chishuiensis TaxID=1434707 RepID=A0A2P8D6A2_9BACT|nr:response regulator transcription factor [Taibaiella chishuiensis]PSK92750.1 LytTR family two component transcriptional regulator [Taibaiella chishuiensis]